MENGQSLQHKGGILLTAMFTLGLLSLLLLFLIDNYRTISGFSVQAKNHYHMRIMTELFLAEYVDIRGLSQAGEITYNVGRLHYQVVDTQLIVTVYSGKDSFIYYHEIAFKPNNREQVDSYSTE